ncbi:MAG TPA: LytTR family DNA-binding domain-containing protein [Bacteroidales bacterium]|nr:LytTR family DNA-binding domain-containing protein [Bacteroidales bacterium]
MKVVIIEDESFASLRLKKLIHDYDSSIEIIAELESVEASVKWFRQNKEPDLIFLDIHLEDDLSFSIFEKISISCPIIFTTAFDEYAIKAFKLNSIDYLLKPIIQEDLVAALKKYGEITGKTEVRTDFTSLFRLMAERTPEYRERFSVSFGTKIKTIAVDQIAYFVSEGGGVFAYLKGKGSYPVDLSLDKLMTELDPKKFFRINRKILVGINGIGEIYVYPKSRLKLDLNPKFYEEVFVSLDKVTSFKRWLDQ